MYMLRYGTTMKRPVDSTRVAATRSQIGFGKLAA